MYRGDIRLGDRLSTIVGLLFTGGPFAVVRAIWAVIVNAFNRQFWIRPWPHVGEEVLKRIQPAVANENPAPAVIFPVITFGFCASNLDVAPDVPFGANTTFARHSVCGNSLAYQLSSKAPTTDAMTISQRRSVNGLFNSAIAAAYPKTLVVPTKNRPSSEAPTCHFDKCWHNLKFTTFLGKMLCI